MASGLYNLPRDFFKTLPELQDGIAETLDKPNRQKPACVQLRPRTQCNVVDAVSTQLIPRKCLIQKELGKSAYLCRLEVHDECNNYNNRLPCNGNTSSAQSKLWNKSPGTAAPFQLGPQDKGWHYLGKADDKNPPCKRYALVTPSSTKPKSRQEVPQLKLTERSLGQKKIQDKFNHINSLVTDPPNSFHQLSLFPTSEDILSQAEPFLRPNIVSGGFRSVDHYFDVQFRLLREDFVGPLREGIQNIARRLESNMVISKHVDDLTIYRKVVFKRPIVFKTSVGILVQFDTREHSKSVDWENSKKFMFGSLLVFSKDDFKHLVFGTVVSSDACFLAGGTIVVKLEDNTLHMSELKNGSYIMVESEIYFEPYYHVLKALQNMKVLPMKEYLVHVDVFVKPPKYIHQNPNYYLGGHTISLNGGSWPKEPILGLDDSQYTALQSALTREFVVIQGPPGTGKTFLGLKIAEALLTNFAGGFKPILVVCFTNHALDQFLEALLSITKKIVRIGGRSQNATLAPYNLRELSRSSKHDGKLGYLIRSCRETMFKKLANIQNLQTGLVNIEEKNGIVSLDVLANMGLLTKQSERLLGGKDVFLAWLLGARDVLKERGEELQNELQNIPNCEDMNYHISFGIWLNDLRNEQSRLQDQLTACMAKERESKRCSPERTTLDIQLQRVSTQIQVLSRGLAEREQYCPFTMEYLLQGNIWQLSTGDRWILYRHWVASARTIWQAQLSVEETKYLKAKEEYESLSSLKDLRILESSHVVGLTTTSAARLQNLLETLGSRIVLVEEAAEVLESHVVVSLSKSCEHLILIGDHKQLRPSTGMYNLAQNFGLDVSLFERMVNNGVDCEVLEVQHRMRPEVSELIVPAIYPTLQNHPLVYKYDHVMGVTKDVFFFSHTCPEDMGYDTKSKRNLHEGDLAVALGNYIVLQGYSPGRVTILVTYVDQCVYISKIKQKYKNLADLRVCVVDGFQGDENDIIILSLVRSNKEGKIGFLKTENRVCVALSRAKIGLYIIGNMKNLVQKSKIWPQINQVLVRQDAVGSHLELFCQRHPLQRTRVSCAKDFERVPQGGCLLPCGASLVCGHVCQSVCHIQDQDHSAYKCLHPCTKMIEQSGVRHRCAKLCWQDCVHQGDLEYSQEVSFKLSDCDHTTCKIIFTMKCKIILYLRAFSPHFFPSFFDQNMGVQCIYRYRTSNLHKHT